MEIIPHVLIYKFLKRLEEDNNIKDSSKIKPPRSTDIIAIKINKFDLYYWTDKDIKIFLLNKWYIWDDFKISNQGKLFLKHYSFFLNRIELWAKDYPFMIWSLLLWIIWWIIWFILTKIIENIIKL